LNISFITLWMNGTDDEDLVLDLEGMMFLMHFQNLLGSNYFFSKKSFEHEVLY